MIISLKDAIEEYNQETLSVCSSMEVLDDGNFAIAIIKL